VGLMIKKKDKAKLEEEMLTRAFVLSKRIAPIYKMLDWKWCGSINGVPQASDILYSFTKLIRNLTKEYKSGRLMTETGGLRVSIEETEEGFYVGEVGFIISEEAYVEIED